MGRQGSFAKPIYPQVIEGLLKKRNIEAKRKRKEEEERQRLAVINRYARTPQTVLTTTTGVPGPATVHRKTLLGA